MTGMTSDDHQCLGMTRDDWTDKRLLGMFGMTTVTMTWNDKG